VSAIVVDTSARVAILTGEPGQAWLAAQLADATQRLIAAPAMLSSAS
jgi:uncharacterized protein with PIN domain